VRWTAWTAPGTSEFRYSHDSHWGSSIANDKASHTAWGGALDKAAVDEVLPRGALSRQAWCRRARPARPVASVEASGADAEFFLFATPGLAGDPRSAADGKPELATSEVWREATGALRMSPGAR
jgi:hypothetical protein